MDIDEGELRTLVARRAVIERQTFTQPPSDWAGFNQKLGRWHEVNDRIKLIEAQISREAEIEEDT